MVDGDRIDRAGRYVLGLMDDDERERAERDLEIDPAFRDAMIVIAERMHVFDRAPAQPTGQPTGRSTGQSTSEAPSDDWRQLKERIDAMPQMRPAPPAEPLLGPPSDPQSGLPVTFGRRRSDKMRGTIVPETPARTIGTGLHSVPGRRAVVLGLCLIAAFALGYAAGVWSAGPSP
jgi:hypothetical protein